ncbi:MAG: sugar ABC transporter substrate-binding protein [Lachnospiraceae bacterium]|nr:sugar ABC transporter substrate-binding protein [Lachnospiraceae bacterium]
MSWKKGAFLLAFFAGMSVCLAVFWYRFHELNGNVEGRNEIYDRHYVMITGREDGDFWDRVYESALAEGKRRGVYVERFGEDLAVEYDRNELLKLAMLASVDGIIVPGDEEEETVALLQEAVEQGIPVVNVLEDSMGSSRQCFVGNNSYNLGQDYGRQILELLAKQEKEGDHVSSENPAKVMVLVDENRTDTSQNLVLLGIRETLENEGEGIPVTVEARPVDNSRSFSSEESIRDIFLNSEMLPDILVCLSAVHTRCAYQAAVDYNQVGTVQMLGYYDSEAILEAVSKNILYSTISLDTEQMGRLCVQALDEYVETGYTNNYMAVDTRLIRAEEAERLVNQE